MANKPITFEDNMDESWESAHPQCEECRERGCPHGCCNMDGLVEFDSLIFHPLCLVKVQDLEARMGR